MPAPVSKAECPSLFASSGTGTIGVVDLQASQAVIGDEQVGELVEHLP